MSIVETCRRLEINLRQYLKDILPKLGDWPMARVAELTPTAWKQRKRPDIPRRLREAVIPEQERRKNKKGNPYWQAFTSGKHAEAGKKILARLGFKLT
jgi:hypothetical protein